MKSISNWSDLKQYGIHCLTGEACALSCRALCDLTEQGQDIIRRFYGLPYNAPFLDSWNSGAVGSCFIPWNILPDLAAFILIDVDKLGMAIHIQDGIYAPEDSDTDEEWQRWIDFQGEGIIRRYSPIGGPKRGCSCVHAMSGRSA